MKMNHFFGTCAAGTQHIAKRILQQQIKDVNSLAVYEGAISFRTAHPYEGLNLYCFHNIFLILDIHEDEKSESLIESHMRKVIEKAVPIGKTGMGKGKSFRIVTSSKNKLVSVNPGLKTQTERYISGQTKLRADRGAGEQEFWFLSRSEGNSYFMRRLSKHASYGKLLKKGELHPEIAYMMSFLAEPCANDLILDPFCGYGAIVEQLLKHFKCGCVYAADIDEAVLQSTIKKAKQYPEAKHEIFNCDVRQLIPKAGKESIDRIITDPPWGIYEMIADIKSFYREFLGIFTSLLKPRGIMVILTAQKEALLEALDETKAFTIAERHDILVSGKKSAIFKLVKG